MNIKHHLYTSGGTRKCKIGRKYFFTQTSKVKHIFLTEMMDWKTGKASQKDVELFILQTGENNMFVLLNNFPTFIFLSQRAFFTEALTQMLNKNARFWTTNKQKSCDINLCQRKTVLSPDIPGIPGIQVFTIQSRRFYRKDVKEKSSLLPLKAHSNPLNKMEKSKRMSGKAASGIH